jgi:hypothetical protein
MIEPALAAFLQEGLAIHIGTRNERHHPNGARGIAVTIDGDGSHAIIYVAKIAAARVLPDLRSNGHVAAVFCRPTDDRTCQIKGLFVSARPAREAERPVLLAQWDGFLLNLERIGIPRATLRAWTTWPAVAIRFRPTALFDQTPGPHAGAPLA